MGVDTWIDSKSLAHCPQAKCRAFRPTADQPIIYWRDKLDDENRDYHYLIPVESFPLSLQILDPEITIPDSLDADLYAVEIITYKVDQESKESFRRFSRWISKEEYQTIIIKSAHQIEGHDRWYVSELLKRAERNTICKSCPLKLEGWQDCSAGLFSYSELHGIRHAVSLLFTQSPHLKTELQGLLDSIREIFPNETERALIENSSSLYEAQIIDVIQEHVPEWKPKAIPDESKSQLADALINLIFFRDYENPEDKWLFGSRLAMLIDWLERLKTLIVNSNHQSEYMERFEEIIEIFLNSCKMAHQYSLKIAISF